MRLLIPEDALVLDDQDHLFWHEISEFSKWAYVFLIFRVFMFFVDWVFDGVLMFSFAREREWVEFTETLVILIGASAFQVYHYHQEQAWIDADHRYLRTDQADGTDGHDEEDPNNENPGASRQESAQAHRGSDFSNTPIFKTEENSSDGCCNSLSVWRWLRRLSKWTIFGLPVFRAFANWRDLKIKEKLIEERRANRKPVDAEEVAAAVTKSERDITNQTFQVIEQFFETLPQSVLQVCLAARANEALQLNSFSFTDGVRLILVVVSLLMTAFSSTKYALDYCRHLKILHFQDYVWFRYKTEFSIVDWPTTFVLFFMHLVVLVTRFYGISYVFVVYGQIHGVMFIALIYFVQYTWLQLVSSCRLMYENPPRGISTNYSNAMDRWTNVFTFHMIKPNIRTVGLYNGLFIVCIAFFKVVFDTFSTVLDKAQISNSFFNYSARHELANDTSSPITYYTAFSCFPCVLGSWAVCCLICFALSWELESRMKPFLRTQFPLAKGFPFWRRVMKCMTWEKVDPKFRRFVCSCILASDAEFSEVFNVFCCNICCNLPKPKPCDKEMEKLWRSLLNRGQSGVPVSLPALNETWELVKRENRGNVYMEGVLELVDSAFRDRDLGEIVLPNEHLAVFLGLVKNFKLNLSERNSLRLHRTEEFIAELYKDNCAIFTGEWRTT